MSFLDECDEVPALLRCSRLLVLCSDYEGFPNVILEAMAAGLPVLTTPAGDASRIVQEGVTGYVFQPEDIRGWAACICRLAENPQLVARLGEAGRKRVSREYNVTSLANRLSSVLCNFASKQGKKSVLRALAQRKGIDASPAATALSPA
jgi:glycosyltransferase involved in cell wall biosynthesis